MERNIFEDRSQKLQERSYESRTGYLYPSHSEYNEESNLKRDSSFAGMTRAGVFECYFVGTSQRRKVANSMDNLMRKKIIDFQAGFIN